jgi:hypothetical protein
MIKITECLSIQDPADDDENGCVEIFDSVSEGSIYILPSDIPPLMAHLTQRAADWLMWSAKQWLLAKFANR